MPNADRPRSRSLVHLAVVAGISALIGLGVFLSASSSSAHEGHGHVLIYTNAPAGPWHDAAIATGAPKLQEALEAEGFEATVSADPGQFTTENLAQYDAVVAFQTNGNAWNDSQKAAMEAWMAEGNGIAAVHNALDMRGNYAWWDDMTGTLMPGHAATGNDPGPQGTVRIEDDTHPSTEHLENARWTRGDEWYNFSTNVRGDAHVLATMDESTYDAGGNKMGYDHPISWCKPYEGGRFWGTAMGHFPSHFEEPDFIQHIVGGVEYAAGTRDGDCGGTRWDSYEKVALDENTSAPFAMDVDDEGKVFYTELVRGQVRVYDPEKQSTSTAMTLDVYSGGEDGLLGIALDPDFADNGWFYVYYSPNKPNNSDPSSFFSNLSRFTYDHQTGTADPATEEVLLEVPARRLPDEPGHTGGGLDFDADGNLYLGVGDDVNPHSEPSGGYAPISERDGTFHDARETSANTNDLRGKLLRITPTDDGGYTVPEGNLFDEAADTGDKTLPEIYAMGFRNPFRFSIDQRTGAISLADYSPDNNNDAPATRGPAGIAEWHLIESPGNYGWPLCMGNNEPFRDVDFRTNPVTVGDYFDCANPINDSVRNTGLTELPPSRAADMWYGYKRSSVPEVIPQGGGLAPMGGPVYNFDPELESDTKFPASLDGKPFFYEWARNKMYSIQLKDGQFQPGGAVEKVNPFLPEEQFLAPIDSKFGPDGSLYVLDWGGGFGRDNPNSGLHRIDYIQGSRSPSANIVADPTSGQAPLTVEFDGTGSSDPEGEDLTYAWDFDGDGETDATDATGEYTYTEEGVFDARLTVTDPDGKTGTTTVPITVGNTRPEVDFNLPPNGAFFDFGDDLTWDVSVTDEEDGEISGDDVVIQPALGHDDHAHPTQPFSGLTGTTPTSLGGHAPDENIFFAIDARYTDQGGENGAPALTGSDTTLVLPKLKEAEFFDTKSDTMALLPGRDIAGHGQVLLGKEGAWAMYSPVNLHQIDQLALRVAASSAGTIELRMGAPDGELLAEAEVPATGNSQFRDVLVDVEDPGETFDLYVVMPGAGDRRLNFIEAIGQGASPDTRPVVAITAPEEGTPLEPGAEVEITADATDANHDIEKVEFFVDGDVKIGEATQAPYSVTWETPTEEKVYPLTAVATNTEGGVTTSRVVGAQVGELFGDLEQFSNAGGEFEKVSGDTFRITGAGANTWQAVNEYSSLYLPGGGDDDSWEAVVKVNSQQNTNGGAKAGLIVRNDISQPGTSPGYALLGVRPNNGVEFLRDTNGDGQLDASSAGGSSSYPKWLKLKRDGDDYTGWWSNNGTTWTQVGGAATLPGAADTQDVGMVTVAHSANAGTSEFQGFSIDSDPEVVAPEKTYAPLSCDQRPLSDEFVGGLNGKWSVRQATGSPVVAQGGQLRLPVTGGDINEGSTGPVSFVGQPVPEGDWTVSTKITLAHSSHWQWAGLVVHQDDNNYNKLAFVRNQNGNRFLEFQTENNGSRTTPAAPTVPTSFPTTVYLRLTNAGGTLTGAYSADGETWTNLAGSLALKPNAQLGVMAAGDVGTPSTTASVDWFRVTPDREAPVVEADDEFDGDALDGCRWGQTVRYDSENLSVADGELRIKTQPGDINGNNPLNPRNFVMQDAPEGDWVATTRFKAPLLHRYQLAGLLMYADDDNYAKADVVAYNAPGAGLDLRGEMAVEKNGSGAGNRNLNIPDSTESGYWYIRVTKEGNSYSTEFSDGGSYSWTSVGEPLTFDVPLRALGLMAIGPEQEEPVTVGFDYFHLDTGEEPGGDTTAPTTELTLDPATPDGENEWYVTAPSFSLAASDEEDGSGVASTEYRIGDGEWTDYTEAVSLEDAEDGELVIEYRSTDEAGNEEEAGSATVKMDRGAPTTEASTEEDGESVVVTLTATDEVSGVAGTEIKVDDAAWVAYTEPVPVEGEGDHVVAYRSTDNAGHVEEAQTVEFTIGGGGEEDVTSPELTVRGVADGGSYGHSAIRTLSWSAADDVTAEPTVTATLDGAAVEAGELPMWSLSVGRHTLVVTATDEAGNESVDRRTFRVTTSIKDVRKMVTQFRAEGAMTQAVHDRLQKSLGKANRAKKDSTTAKWLKTAQKQAADIRTQPQKKVVRADIKLLRQRVL